MIELPELPYKEDALEPYISKKTIEFHYGKHHKKYVDNVNKLIKNTGYENASLDKIIEDSSGTVFDNAAQVKNHTFFWESMTDNFEDLDEDSKLYKAITKKYKSFDGFKDAFKEKATKVFGSGWIWLTTDEEYVNIETTHNAQQPKHHPLLVCDLWEHSYYLDYQNDRGQYIDGFFNVINWDFAGKNYKNGRDTKSS